MPWFRKKKGKIEPVRDSERVVRTENVFVRCEECGEHLYKKELEDALQVCVHCDYHFRIGAYDRLEK
ncbi:MAG: acetyl-CoA carboxylase carboxyl transferase subunit beta, partial [Verrucomicrobia bacterium]